MIYVGFEEEEITYLLADIFTGIYLDHPQVFDEKLVKDAITALENQYSSNSVIELMPTPPNMLDLTLDLIATLTEKNGVDLLDLWVKEWETVLLDNDNSFDEFDLDEFDFDFANYDIDDFSFGESEEDLEREQRKFDESVAYADDVIDNPASKEEWINLYETARHFRAQAPWETFYDMDLIVIEHPETGEKGYCSIMGKGGEFFGVGLYIGNKGLRSFNKMAFESDTVPEYQLINIQDCLLVAFEDRNDLDPMYYDHIKSLDLSFRGKKQWPEIKKFESGYYPWLHLDHKDVQWLTIMLEQVMAAEDEFLNGEIKPNFEYGDFLKRKKEGNHWVSELTSIPTPEMIEENLSFVFEDELLQARLLKEPKFDYTLQIDIPYLPEAIMEDQMSRPVFPRLILIVDAASQMILTSDMHAGNVEPRQVIDCLAKICQSTGVPTRIEVRPDSIEWMLEDFCQKVGIELFPTNNLDSLDTSINELFHFLR